MTDATRRLAERRVLILTPTGRDAPLTRDVLAESGIRSVACDDIADLIGELDVGAGMLLLSEEALPGEDTIFLLAERMSRQPPWSDLPILLLAHPGADSSIVRMAVRQLGNVTLLERPVRVAALLTAAQSALRARQRQFHAREHLQELDDVAHALRESESRLQALFSNAAVGIAEVNSEGRFALVNDALCLLLGEKREALLSLPFPRVAHGEDRLDVEHTLQRFLGGGEETFSGERRFVRSDGETIWVKLSLSPARTNGDAPSVVAVVEDVTERRHAEQDLLEADRRKDEFLAVLAHELRNPLAPIRNSLLILRHAGGRDAATERVIDMMERQVGQMVRLVDDLLEVSRISRGKIELRREPVELATVLRAAVETSRPLIEGARHTLTVDVPNGVWLDADAVRLSQVFANLLNNAAKYTPPGGQIDLTAKVAAGVALVCVKDNGEGIAEDMVSRVFNMFTQVNTGRRAQGGLGIGLTLARTLVHLHGGTIEASSGGPGLGCEFLVRLPVAEAHAQAAAPARLPVGEQPFAHQRVLVVDDNHDAADSLGILLRFLGAEVHVVHDGRSALEAMGIFKPRVVLLDLGMPNMDGLEVARRMREDPQMRQATIVALTGWGQHEDRRRTGEAGFDYHLVKPADISALQSILSMHAAPQEGVRH